MSESCKIKELVPWLQGNEIICFELNQAEMVDLLKLNVLMKLILSENNLLL
jgi:hypothetical protein